jgi:hypothetical protein
MTIITGSASDLLCRLQRVIPFRWFSNPAPNYLAVAQALLDNCVNAFNLVSYARLQTRLATATGPWLDIFVKDFLGRFIARQGASDSVFRAIARATILQERVTRAGMINAITQLVNSTPIIFEPWNPNDTGAWGVGNLAYNKAGGYGSIQLPGQTFMRVSRSGLGATGIPSVDGYQGYLGGYGVGQIQYAGATASEIGVTDQDIYDMILATKPTGSTVWVQID